MTIHNLFVGLRPEAPKKPARAVIIEELGSEYLVSKKSQTELRTISKEIVELRKKLAALEARKAELERAVKT